MERLDALITRLREQYDKKADAAQLLLIVQQLQQELHAQAKTTKTLGTSKVAVMLPGGNNIDTAYFERYAPRPAAQEQEAAIAVIPVQEQTKEEQPEPVPAAGFDPLLEIPTLSHQVRPEPQKKTAADNDSLNDRLKRDQPELLNVLKDSPIKDLRKAIGINDRFLFINDLFRGDEAMYERSIKTINSFNIYAEAEYWISRELKVKLGWDEEQDTVLQFDQLVKRRFS